MRLLFITQVLDKNDTVLGAYHEWVRGLAERVESIEVICLYEGEHALPSNVRVHSLGKENGVKSGIIYGLRFLMHAWRLRKTYDGVFVHMNQEYLLIAGVMWKVLRKRMYMYRNHYAGSWFTDLAAAFCAKVFCTSKHSYTAKYKKTVFMPVGVDTARFQVRSVVPIPESILFLARIAPSKRPDVFIEALGLLRERAVRFTASVYGSPLPTDQVYYEEVKARSSALGLDDHVRFYPAVANIEAPAVFSAHEVFVNCSPSGMFDKTLFEAASCGAYVLAVSEDFATRYGTRYQFEPTPQGLANRLQEVLVVQKTEREGDLKTLRDRIAQEDSLNVLVAKLSAIMQTP